MTPPEILPTRRLVMQRPRIEDAAEMFQAYAQDPAVTRFLTWRPHRSLADTQLFLRASAPRWEEGTEHQWLLRRRDGALVGAIALRPKGFKAEIGYLIAQPHWRQGYATEAVCALIDWCWAQPEIYRVWAVCDIDNTASARVMEKAGMQCEGILRRWMIHPNLGGQPRDCLCYARVKEG